MQSPSEVFGPIVNGNGAFFRLYLTLSNQADDALSSRFITYILVNAQCNACRQPVSAFALHSPGMCKEVPRPPGDNISPDQLEYFIPVELVKEFKAELRRDNQRRYKKWRASRARENGGEISPAEKSQLLAVQQRRCYYCFKEFDEKSLTDRAHLDHYVSVMSGGHSGLGNRVYACGSCNSKKSAVDGLSFRIRKLKSLSEDTKTALVRMRRDVKKWKES